MYIMSSTCFNSTTKPIASPVKTKIAEHENLIEKFIIDNPFIFRVCCFCISRRRKRVDTAKLNGNGHHDRTTSDDTVLTIDQIEFTRSTIDLNENAKSNGNELTIQPITLSIGLVESDDAASVQNVVNTQPSATGSKKSEEIVINNKDLVENYVEEQVRRTTSGKTNSHILSDVESSPMHIPAASTSTDIETVRNEIAQIQSAIQTVKKEMEEMQKQKSTANTPSRKADRPPSVTSNKTFIFEAEDTDTDAACEHHHVIIQEPESETIEENIEEHISPQKSRPQTAKSVLHPQSPFTRITTPTPDDVINDDQVSNSPYEPTVEMPTENEHEETEEASENIHEETDEVDRSSNYVDPLIMIRSDSTMTLSREQIIEDYEENVEQDTDYQEASPSPVPPEVLIKVQRTPVKIVHPPVHKVSQKTTPVRNPIPNIKYEQMSPVVIRPPKPNALFPPSLRRFERPKDAISTTMHQLESSNWEDVMDGLKNFVRLIRHHPEYIDAKVHLFTLAIAKQVKNLRSQVSRASCSAANEFFMTHAKVLDGDAEELAAALLNRTADTNKFLRADATGALEAMCDAMHPSKTIMILSYRGATHQNAAVRCTTAKLLNQLVFRIGCDKVFNLHREIRDRLILTGANLLMEGSLETRNHTKELFKQLSIHSHYQKILLDVIPTNVYRNIEKTLKSIR